MEYYVFSPLFLALRIIEVFSEFVLALVISNEKIKFAKLLLVTFLFTILFEFSKPIIPQYLSSTLSSILAVSIFIFVLKINYKKAILSYIITIISMAIIDCIVSLTIIRICNIPTFEGLVQNQPLVVLGKIAIIFISFLTSLTIKTIRYKNNSTYNVKNSINLVTLIVTFLLLMPNLAMILYYHDNKPLPLTLIIINIVAIIATFVINIFNTQRSIKLIQAEEELITEKTYISTLKQLVDDLRTFKHDYDNTLNTIKGFIYVKDFDGLTSFVGDVVKETRTISTLNKLNPELFKNSSIFGLVTAKFEYAKKSDVAMNIEIYCDLDNLAIKTYDFTRILGILFDNAIEASAGTKQKIVNFLVVGKDNKVTIEISNSFSNTGLTVEEMTKKGVSSKGENRGLGLYKVNEILEKYPKIIHEVTSADDIFLQRIIIDKVALPIS